VVKFTINDKELEVEEGTSVLEAARAEGIKIPTLCYHEEMSPYGACRLCLVEVIKRGWPSLQPACLYKVFDGLIVNTDTDRVKKTRNVVFELLLARCPDSEEVRKLAAEYGVTETRIELKKTDNCILCGMCVRACAEISQRHAFSFVGRGSKRTIKTPFDEISSTCVGCGACAYVCPTKCIEIKEVE
jgi:NADH dehydrogenase/NADH:ubiquinone oxidoreductase subunit G